jgi:hypothetical protein
VLKASRSLCQTLKQVLLIIIVRTHLQAQEMCEARQLGRGAIGAGQPRLSSTLLPRLNHRSLGCRVVAEWPVQKR